jgi:hypothetical protein
VADLLEPATSARAKCRGCGRKIEKGELRFGECLPNPFGEGDATFWFHLVCAACMRSDKLLSLLSASELDVAERARLEQVAEVGVAHPRAMRVLHAERSPSGRARCRSCRELIESGAWRLSLGIFDEGRMEPIGFIHVECSAAYFETGNVLGRIVLLTPDLTDRDREELSLGLAVARPAPAETGPALAKTSAKDDADATPAPRAKRSG